jgi:hypothetical protein
VAVVFQTATGYIFIQHLIIEINFDCDGKHSIMYDDPDIPGVRLPLFVLRGSPLLPC